MVNNMKIFKKSAFTLVELIIVIVILSILATIAFLSYQWFSENTRDSVRLTDLKNMKKFLSIYEIDKNYYPEPDNAKKILFSWATVWIEWVFWDNTRKILWNKSTIGEIPTDPLTWNRYTYSVTNNKLEYQIWIWLERNNKTSYTNINNKVNASLNTLTPYIEWNYNKKVIKVSTWWIDYILTVPSIITSNDYDFINKDLNYIIENKKLVYENYSWLPSSYSWILSQNNNIFDFSWWNNVVFKGSFKNLYNDKQERMKLFEKIAERYKYSNLEWEEWYKIFSKFYSDTLNPTSKFIDYSCFVIWNLINDKKNSACFENNNNKLVWEAYTWALMPDGSTNYIWQWPLWDPYNYWQGLQIASHERNSLWLKWWLNKTIGIKWKLLTKNKAPNDYFWWEDIDWDWINDYMYLYWWKIILVNTDKKVIKWQTKPYDIKKILWVENIMWDWSKSIIVSLWVDWYIWIINWKTWNLDWISSKVSGWIKKVKTWWPSLNYKIFDINWDWINEYHFKQRYHKYTSMKFFKNWNKAAWETLWDSESYWNYNYGSDWYQPSTWSMWKINNKLIVWTKWSNTFSFYSNNVNSNAPWLEKFKMPAFGKLIVWWDSYHWRSRSLGYFYDINWDWNDEYIARIDKELNNNKYSRIISSWYTWWEMKQFMSLATTDWTFNNYTSPIALKNYSNPSDSYILTKWEDPVSHSYKWMLLKYNWENSSAYKKNSNLNESFNYKIIYDAFNSNFTPVGIFNNWNKDYIVLYKSWYYYFYIFNWIHTFDTESTLKIAWSFAWNTIFDWLDINREKNKDSGIFLASYDTNWNSKKEFVVSSWWYFKFYEIDNSWINLIKSFRQNVSWVRKRWLTKNKKDLYAISYNYSKNTVNYSETNSISWNYSFTKLTNDTFYSWWETNDMVISKLWQWSNKFNRLMIKWIWMFDARNATPTTSPIKISNEFFYSYDMDKDWENEIFISGKAYKYNSPWNYTLKYNNTAWQWDIDWDWVLDSSYSYCKSTANYYANLFYTIRSWKDNSQIIPDLDWWNWNGRCSWWNIWSWVSYDFNWDRKDDFVIWLNARSTRILSLSWGVLNEWNQITRNSAHTLSKFDFDWDWVDEIIRSADDDFKVYKIDNINKTKLNPLFSISRSLKSTLRWSWGRWNWLASIFKDKNKKVYMAFRWVDWEVALYSWDKNSWLKFLFKNYYLYTKKYSSDAEVLNNWLVPIATADVLLWDFMHNDSVQVLVWWWDWYVYIIWLNWKLIRAFNIWSSIKRMIIWDTNNDLLIDILIWAEDWYVYQISSSILNSPSIINDSASWDINSQSENKKVSLSFKPVENILWYNIQLYNYTKKSPVFDWIDIWNSTSKCIVSNDYSWDLWDCIKLWTSFTLTENSIYVWRVQSYNSEMSSAYSMSNWFYITP